MTDKRYSQTLRRQYIGANLDRYESQGYSYRDIAWDVRTYFGLDRSPSPATIGNDLRWLKGQVEEEGVSEEAQRLLEPENFPKWRRTLFTAPGGEPYDTPRHQMALFWMIVGLALRIRPPEWVRTFFNFTDEDFDDIEQMEKLLTFILLVAPRHGKTELVMHALIWLICYNRNIRIIYIQGIARTASRVMQHIEWELEHNEKLVELYGAFRDDDCTWNKEEFEVCNRIASKSPTMLPGGIGSNLRSLDADIIVIDDPQDLKRVKSEVVAQNDYEQVTTELMTRREKHTPVIGIGSHLPTVWGDLWSMLEDSVDDLTSEGQVIHVRKIPAHNDEICTGDHSMPNPPCVLWPRVRPWWFLMAQKAMMDRTLPGLFDVVYNQKTRAIGLDFFRLEALTEPYYVPDDDDRDEKGAYKAPGLNEYGILDYTRSWKEWPTCCGTVRGAVGFDPAASQKKGGAESALIVRAACDRCGRRFIVDYWHRQQSPERHPDTIRSYVEAYHEYGLRNVRTEINAYQKSLSRDPRMQKMQRELGVHVSEWTTDDRKWSPELGVPNMAIWQNQGMLSLPYKTKADQAFADAYLRAYKRYPALPTDIVMGDWLAELELAEMLRMLFYNTPEQMPGFSDLPEYLIDQVVEFDLSTIGDDSLYWM